MPFVEREPVESFDCTSVKCVLTVDPVVPSTSLMLSSTCPSIAIHCQTDISHQFRFNSKTGCTHLSTEANHTPGSLEGP